jgi:hypothetical protein
MPLIQLIYTSCLLKYDPHVISPILVLSQQINSARKITGMLLLAKSAVLEVLEGEEDAVLRTFRSIERDKRHDHVCVLTKNNLVTREFASWTLGFSEFSDSQFDSDPFPELVCNANKIEISRRVRPGPAMALLAMFAEGVEELR